MERNQKMSGTIEIENMEFYAFHGCFATEKKVGNQFFVTVRLDTFLEDAAKNDDVNKTINYVEVYNIAAAEMAVASNILENVAGRIIDSLYKRFPQLQKVTVKVSKMYPPVGGKVEKTSVTLTR